jgi:hypothetical protein
LAVKISNTNTRPGLGWSALIGSTFIFYFAILLYSECGLPGRSWENIEKKRLVQGLILIVAGLLVVARASDHRARIGALFLAVAGTMPAFPHQDMREVWRDLPTPLGAILWIPQLTHFMALPLLFTFYAILPRPFFKRTWDWIIAWAPALIFSGWGIHGLYQHIYDPKNGQDLPRWYLFVVGMCVLLYGFGGLAALVTNYCQTPPNDRRRLTILTGGAVLGWSPGLLFLAAIFLAPLTESPLVWSLVVPPFKHIALAAFPLVPLSLAYAVFRDDALEVPDQRPPPPEPARVL